MRKQNKLIRNENGSITIFVVLAVMFLAFVLIGVYVNYSNKFSAQLKELAEIEGNYDKYDSQEELDKLYADLTETEQLPGDTKPKYTELEYIESTGTQWIDTGITLVSSDSFSLETEVLFAETDTRQVIGNYQGRYFEVNSSGKYAIGNSKTEIAASTDSFDKITLSHDGNTLTSSLYINGNLGVTRSTSINTISSTDLNKLPLFCTYYKTPQLFAQVKLKETKITLNNVLVRHFIPVLDSNGVACLYDKVEGKFYYNQGDGEFLYGEKTKPVYTELEYIESTGTQYIDTNYICSSDTKPNKIESEFQFTKQGTGINYLFATFKNTGNEYPLAFGTDPTKNAWMFGHFNSGKLEVGNASVRFGTFDTNKHKVKYVFNEGIYLDEVLQEDTVAQAATSSNSEVSLVLCAAKRGTTINSYACLRLYSFKMYEGDNVLVRDFIPVLDSNGVACLYDKVEGKFYYNQGTGTFLYGEKQEPEYTELEYIESTGAQYILTDIIPASTKGIYAKLSSSDTSSDLIYFGSKGTASNSRFHSGNVRNQVYLGWNSLTPSASRPSTSQDQINELELNYLNSKTTKYNGTIVDNITAELDSTNTYPIAIFALNNAGSIGYKSKIKLYELKISDGNKIIRDFIPVLDKDNVPCLYDKVEGKFYYNQGEGEFLYE